MLDNAKVSHVAKAPPSHLLAGQFPQTKAFYDQVRSNFLQQSAKYLRESLSTVRTPSVMSS